jgi:hypothetical protein
MRLSLLQSPLCCRPEHDHTEKMKYVLYYRLLVIFFSKSTDIGAQEANF